MKKYTIAALVSFAGLMGVSAQAGDADADAGAKIISGLQVANTTGLYFGSIIPSAASSGTVLVSAAGAQTCGTGLTCLSTDYTAAGFNVAGQDGNTYSITLPTSVTLDNGSGDTMSVDSFVGSKANGTLVDSADTFTVGGTLNVGQDQAVGDYNGSFTVTVEYN